MRLVLGMGVAILVLLIVISLLIPQISIAKEKEAQAQALAASTKSLLRALDIRCTARENDLIGIQRCIEPQLRKNDFKIDTFLAFNEKRNETGVFVISNQGSKTYEGSAFSLSKNGKTIATGCHIKDQILSDYTCRFDLKESCLAGDVYEISYQEQSETQEDLQPIRLITKTC